MIRSSRADARRQGAKRLSSLRHTVMVAAVLAAIGGGTIASATSLTWDNTGGLQTPDWQLGTIPASAGIWDPTNAADNSGGAPTHWAGNTDVGAGNTGVLSGTSDPTNAYFIEIPDSGVGNASGFSVTQGSYIMPGYGNGGLGHGINPSYVNIGSGTFNINVATGASLALGYSKNLLSFQGSATIVKTGDGFLNDVTNLLNAQIGSGTFTGKWDIEGGSFGLFYGGNTMLGEPSAFTADQLKIDNNAVIDTFQNGTSVQISNSSSPLNGAGYQGITIGSGGATFFCQGEHALDGVAATQMGAIVFNSKITGGSSASPVTITWKSNLTDVTASSPQGHSQGGPANLYVDNHTSLFAKWIVNTGEIVPNDVKSDNGLASNNDLGLGAVPSTYLADAITLDRDTTGTAATDVNGNAWQSNVLAGGPNIRVDKFGGWVVPVNRGIYVGPGGGGLHPADATNPANNEIIVSSIISGPGQLRILLESSQSRVVLNNYNSYTGGTWITAAAGGTPQSDATQSYLQVNTAYLPPHQAGFTNTGTITVGQYTLPNSDIINDGNLDFDQAFDGTYSGTISTSSVTSNAPSNVYTPVGNLTKNSAGVVLFSGKNTYIGTTTINGGALVADSTASLPGYSVSHKVTVNSGAALAVTTTNWSGSDINTVENSALLNAGSYFGFNVPAANTYSYDTSTHPTAVGIFKVGGGDLTITGNNPNGSGATWIRGGKLIFATGAALGNPAGTITINGGTLQYGSSTNMGNHPIVIDAVNGGTISQPNGYQDSSHGAAITGGPLTYSGSTGSLFGATSYSLSSLTVTGGTLRVNSGSNSTSLATAVAINGGTMDLTNNRLVTSTAVGTFSGGSYTANSISRYIHDGVLGSSTAAAQGGLTTLAVSTGANVKGLSGTQTATWGGQTVHATDTLVMYSYAGDATLDGQINGDDYFRIDSGYAGHLTGYDNGDFNLDGRVDADDYFIIDSNYGNQTLGITAPAAPLDGVAAVPEPATAALLTLAGGILLARRRR